MVNTTNRYPLRITKDIRAVIWVSGIRTESILLCPVQDAPHNPVLRCLVLRSGSCSKEIQAQQPKSKRNTQTCPRTTPRGLPSSSCCLQVRLDDTMYQSILTKDNQH